MPKGGLIAPGTYQNDIETDRQIVRSLTGGTPRSGALTGFTISPHGSLLRMTVAAGRAIVAAKTADLRRGSYFAWNETTEDVVFGAPSASPRIDAMCLVFGDSQYGALGSGVVNGPQWLVVAGTPNASPVAPADSAIDTAVGSGSWVRWANVRIDPGNTTIQSGNITRLYTSDLAGSPPVVTADPINPYDGQMVYRADTDTLQVYDGGNAEWDKIPLGAPASYTPTWTAVTTNPVLNNGTIAGSWTQIGKMVQFRIVLTIGSSTTFGSGAWRFSLPVAALSATMAIGSSGLFSDVSGPTAWPVVGGRCITTTTFEALCPNSQTDTRAGLVTNASPFIWATGDTMEFIGSYQAA